MVKQKKSLAVKDDNALAEQKVLDYLRKQNRPYSATDISNNLHGAVTKVIAQKVLTSLVDKGEVVCKPYGKQSVYVISQEQFESPSPDELNNMDVEIEDLKKEVNDYKERNKQLQSALSGLTNSLTNEQIEEKLKTLAEKNNRNEERLQELKSGTKSVSVEDKNRIEALYAKNRKLWRQRKRMFDEILAQIADATEKKTRELTEDLGIETDPDELKEDPFAN
ncbi:putative hop2 protein [Gigaspora margarita]|uniref:Homologous-pairing protein 2 homolog n=1 Tax=Gigaspora margarita TaxID=4874 RepID=A0A8H4ETX7_GIGMA|nr:putative hop2 protein [Gigaspora margarita]